MDTNPTLPATGFTQTVGAPFGPKSLVPMGCMNVTFCYIPDARQGAFKTLRTLILPVGLLPESGDLVDVLGPDGKIYKDQRVVGKHMHLLQEPYSCKVFVLDEGKQRELEDDTPDEEEEQYD